MDPKWFVVSTIIFISLDCVVVQVFDIGKGNSPITGLEFHKLPNRERYFIIATTPNRIYQFVGDVNNSDERPLLQQIFNVYLAKAGLSFTSNKDKFFLNLHYRTLRF